MSTRCQIGFYERDNKNILKPDALIYRHCDGYPGALREGDPGVLQAIVPFLKRFNKERGYDVEYASAWLLHNMIEEYRQGQIEWAKSRGAKDAPADGRDFLGHGISKDFHGDIAYYYGVWPDKVVWYQPNFHFEVGENSFTEFDTVSLVAHRKKRAVRKGGH